MLVAFVSTDEQFAVFWVATHAHDGEDRMTSAMLSELLPKMKILLFLREANEQIKHLELLSTIFFWVRSIGHLWDVSQHLAKEAMNLRGGNWRHWQTTDTWLVSELTIGNTWLVLFFFCTWLVHSVIFTWTLNKGKQMGFGFKQPLVGEKCCVTTLITVAEETNMSANSPNNVYRVIYNHCWRQD